MVTTHSYLTNPPQDSAHAYSMSNVILDGNWGDESDGKGYCVMHPCMTREVAEAEILGQSQENKPEE